MQRIYDISRTLSPTLAVWPGDDPFSLKQVANIEQGDTVNVTSLSLSAHVGTHIDAPYHYSTTGAYTADLDLSHYIGPAHVVTTGRKSGGITSADFKDYDLAGVQRLLIHTWVSEIADSDWPQDFPYPSVELIDWLGAQNVLLIGVDMPSVDHVDSKTLDTHHRIHYHDMRILENICLKNVPDGIYELFALPLKIANGCGSPVRAILRELS